MKVLVTGATGFIGSHLAKRLADAGDRVRALVRTGSEASGLERLGVEIVRGDIRDGEAVERAVAGQELVYHLARALASSSRGTMRSVNVEGSATLARAAARAGVARLVHAGSIAVYGRIGGPRHVNEDSALRLDTPYAVSKARGEEAAREGGGDRLPVTVARITSVLGPGASRWLPLFRSVASGRFRLIGSGINRLHPADVSDIVDGLLRCGSAQAAGGRTYILAGPEAVRLADAVKLVAEETRNSAPRPRAPPPAPFRLYALLSAVGTRTMGLGLPHVDAVTNFFRDLVLDISRAGAELGYAPKVTVRETVHRTAEWYRAEGRLPSPAGARG